MTTSHLVAAETVTIDALDLSGRMRPADAAQLKVLESVLDETPPVLVLVDGEDRRLLDGFMRVDAARALGRSTVRVEWVLGDAALAWERAIRTNSSHGLPLSARQRRDAALRLLALAPQWSDRRIGTACGVNAKTVGRLRKDRSGRAGVEMPHLSTEERVGRDGRRYPSAEELGRRREAARRLLEHNAGLSDRAAARATGLSAATVRRVREQLQLQPQAKPQPDPGQQAQARPRSARWSVRQRRVAAVVEAVRRTGRAIARRLAALLTALRRAR